MDGAGQLLLLYIPLEDNLDEQSYAKFWFMSR
jgi:hypothetical protein